MMARKFCQAIWLSSFIVGAYSTALDAQQYDIPIIDATPGTAALGAGYRSGISPYKNVDNLSSITNENDTDLVPLYLYEGKHFFAHGTEGGIHLLTSDSLELDLLARFRFDRLEPGVDEFFDGVYEREQTVDGGLQFTLKQKWGEVSITALNDMLSKHEGQELSASYKYNIRSNRWMLTPYITTVYQSNNLVNYYYGVSAAESRADLPQYQPGSAQFLRAGINTSYQWPWGGMVFANIAYEGLDDPVINSPLVDEESMGSAYIGFAYRFGNLLTDEYMAANLERAGEWSWRVNYGYTAEETFHKVHRGYIKASERVDTNLVGLTLGKLLSAGNKIDYWGKLSINRRLEDGNQDDFFEYNAYVMAMGTGYSSFTGAEIFRYGFGFGFSYASEIPWIEQVKQAERGENTSQFLNYLEAQLDVPLRNYFKSKSVQNCYVGLTIVHRSGIFATSDIIGNVSGGSDVLSAHLECKR